MERIFNYNAQKSGQRALRPPQHHTVRFKHLGHRRLLNHEQSVVLVRCDHDLVLLRAYPQELQVVLQSRKKESQSTYSLSQNRVPLSQEKKGLTSPFSCVSTLLDFSVKRVTRAAY